MHCYHFLSNLFIKAIYFQTFHIWILNENAIALILKLIWFNLPASHMPFYLTILYLLSHRKIVISQDWLHTMFTFAQVTKSYSIFSTFYITISKYFFVFYAFDIIRQPCLKGIAVALSCKNFEESLLSKIDMRLNHCVIHTK